MAVVHRGTLGHRRLPYCVRDPLRSGPFGEFNLSAFIFISSAPPLLPPPPSLFSSFSSLSLSSSFFLVLFLSLSFTLLLSLFLLLLDTRMTRAGISDAQGS
jgi:hypothetical protein